MKTIKMRSNTLSFLKLSIRIFFRFLFLLLFIILAYKVFNDFRMLYQNRERQMFVAEFRNFRHTYWLDVPKVAPCENDTKLFILILSRRETYMNRHAIRETWYKDRLNGTELRFFLADENSDKKSFGDIFWSFEAGELNRYILEEHEYFGDTVFLNGIPDTYANLHIMMHAAFQWQQQFCPQAKYVLKTDDDTVVHLKRLDHWIQQKFDKELESENPATCFGCPVINSKPMRDSHHRWYVPEEVYPNKTYPNYVQGCTYMCSSLAISQILEHCPAVNAINMEDVLYTGIVAEKANVSRSDQRWHFFWGGPYFGTKTYCDQEGVPYITAVFGHIYTLELFQSLYDNLTTVGCHLAAGSTKRKKKHG